MEEIYKKLRDKIYEDYLSWEEVDMVLLQCLEKINKKINLDFNVGFEIMTELKKVIPNMHISKMVLLDLKEFDGEDGQDKAFNVLLNMWCQTFIMKKEN